MVQQACLRGARAVLQFGKIFSAGERHSRKLFANRHFATRPTAHWAGFQTTNSRAPYGYCRGLPFSPAGSSSSAYFSMSR